MKSKSDDKKQSFLEIIQSVKNKLSEISSFNKKACLVTKKTKKDSSKPLRIELARLLAKKNLMLKKI